jgi:hypothetical protein
MSRGYTLVLRGRIAYHPASHEIYFEPYDAKDKNSCLVIDVRNMKVTTRGANRYYCEALQEPVYRGNELLANGSRYWLRLRREAGKTVMV